MLSFYYKAYIGNPKETLTGPQKLHIPFKEIVITSGHTGSSECLAFDLKPLSLHMTAPTMATMAFYSAFLEDMKSRIEGRPFNTSWYSSRRDSGETIDDIRKQWLRSAGKLIAVLTEGNRYSKSSIYAADLLNCMTIERAHTFEQVESVFKNYYQQYESLIGNLSLDAEMVFNNDVAQWIHHPEYNWTWRHGFLEIMDRL